MEKVEPQLAEALSRAHAALLNDLRKLEEAERPASKTGLPALRARLDGTRAHIVEHFRFEEQNGYMDTVRTHEPRLERVIDELAEDHCRLLDSLDALIRETAMAASTNETITAKVTEWIGEVRRHEAQENRLVQDAFNMDIGPED